MITNGNLFLKTMSLTLKKRQRQYTFSIFGYKSVCFVINTQLVFNRVPCAFLAMIPNRSLDYTQMKILSVIATFNGIN